MDYLLRFSEAELQSTGFMEIGPGKYTGLHWQKGFVFVRDDAFGVAEGIVVRHFPSYDHLGMNDLPRDVAAKIISEWRDIADRLPFLKRKDIQTEMYLIASCFVGLDAEVESHRPEVASFLKALASVCEGFTKQSDWICILGI